MSEELLWSDAHELPPAGFYRGRVLSLPPTSGKGGEGGTSLYYSVRVARDGTARQTIRYTHWQEVEVDVTRHVAPVSPRVSTVVEVSASGQKRRRDAASLATVRFIGGRQNADERSIGELYLHNDMAEVVGTTGTGLDFVLRSDPFEIGGEAERRVWSDSIYRGVLPAGARLRGWCGGASHLGDGGRQQAYGFEISAESGLAWERSVATLVDAQLCDARLFPLDATWDAHRGLPDTAPTELIAVRCRPAEMAMWPPGWAQCVGELAIHGRRCKLLVWAGDAEAAQNGANEPLPTGQAAQAAAGFSASSLCAPPGTLVHLADGTVSSTATGSKVSLFLTERAHF